MDDSGIGFLDTSSSSLVPDVLSLVPDVDGLVPLPGNDSPISKCSCAAPDVDPRDTCGCSMGSHVASCLDSTRKRTRSEAESSYYGSPISSPTIVSFIL